ncbi:beta-N-acetylhexosaminidase [Salicibibacter halophilus]|uniref:beta-N-acetylhexosaminidase n=1 Tax=Salicibibacter halophilus TaxID=2502791 RepID=A0A514LIM2_9BACI|nr:glycoside hydrolase family 3 protein [Salicibibacter halophilus]QDI91698.1 beta-N-acetylhexosaminidase [Salicibibacter halophilus]
MGRCGVITILFLVGLAASAWSLNEGGASVKDFILYENIEQAEIPSTDSFALQGMHIYDDGHFTFVNDGITWSSNNESVAVINDDGEIAWTGAPGRAVIEASDGTYQDQIVLVNSVDRHHGGNDVLKQTTQRHAVIPDAIEGMTVEEKVGQMLMPAFRTWGHENVTQMLPGLEQLVKQHHLGGVILFGGNMQTPAQTTELIADYQASSEKYGMLIGADQEGGLVQRIPFGTGMPGNMILGAGNDPDMTKETGRVIGTELQSLGINMNMAPSIDVNNNPDNPVIGVRSFGEDPGAVAKHGIAYMKGLQATGVAATAKHFPGHGDTAVDSHIGSPEVGHDRHRLSNVEWVPFQKAMDHDVDAMMTAHVTLPDIDPRTVHSVNSGKDITLPATLSDRVLTDLMRDEMGYDGVIFTDALEMNAISAHFEPADAAIRAVKAGSDIIVMPVALEEVAKGMVDAVKQGEIDEKNIDASIERILELKIKRGIVKEEHPPPLEEKVTRAEETVRSKDHLAVEEQAAAQGVTVVKNEQQALPIQARTGDEEVVVIGTKYAETLARAMKAHHPGVEAIPLPENGRISDEQWQKIRQADNVVAETHTSDADMRRMDHPQMEMVRRVDKEMTYPLITVAVRNPYDLTAYPEVDGHLAQYGTTHANFAASAGVLFGNINPEGRLPVAIPSTDGGILYDVGDGVTYE